MKLLQSKYAGMMAMSIGPMLQGLVVGIIIGAVVMYYVFSQGLLGI